MKNFVFMLFFLSLYCINANSQLPADLKRKAYQNHYRSGVGQTCCMVLSPKCNILDTCILKVTYSLRFVIDTIKKDKMEDIQQLELGHHVSSCCSYLLYQQDSACTALSRRGITEVPIQDKYFFPEEVITYPAKKQIQVRYRTGFDFTNLCYGEALPDLRWSLNDEHRNILGYDCQKAQCTFRGRKYIAWYSTEIPIKAGPYKFGGLPGLILAISDTENDYCWACIGIRKGNKNDFVTQNKSKYMKEKTVTREKVRDTIKRLHKDPAGCLYKSKQIQHVLFNNTSGSRQDYVALSGDFPPEPYNPIEKE